MDHDRTQPVRHTGPRLDFGLGVYMVLTLSGAARVTQSGLHIEYVSVAEVVYESSIGAELLKQRSFRQ